MSRLSEFRNLCAEVVIQPYYFELMFIIEGLSEGNSSLYLTWLNFFINHMEEAFVDNMSLPESKIIELMHKKRVDVEKSLLNEV